MRVNADLFGARPTRPIPPRGAVTIAAYGGGVNSTAMLVGWITYGLPLDLVLFSDPGGERPETLRHLEAVDVWLRGLGYPPIERVRKVDASGELETLEQNCLDHQTLPSLAYGFKKCSQKFKIGPQDKFVNNWAPARAAWQRGERVVKLIGYDADEPHRADRAPVQTDKYWYRYPLIEWGWGRQECIAAIKRAGLDVPPKSACFFCPASTREDIKALAAEHPDLLARALKIEENAAASNQTVRGLGRRFSWRDLILGRPVPLLETAIACECYDGGDEEEAA
jgi:hypothetical protein